MKPPREVKFLADMGISPRCVEWLRNKGFDAVHLYEQGLYKLPDNEILNKAVNENRILLTVDLDFARLVSAVEADNLPTVVIFRLVDQRPKNMQNRLEALLPVILQNIRQGDYVFSVSEKNVRIRKLPIKRF